MLSNYRPVKGIGQGALSMHKIFIAAGMSLLTACSQPSARGDPEAEIRAADAEVNRAYIDGDTALMNRYFTDDFQFIDSRAAVHDKQNWLKLIQQVDLLHARADDVKVTMLGPDSAFVTARFSGRYRYKGKEEDFTERYTNVWVRRDGQWQMRHEHSSMLPKAQPQQGN